MEQKLQQAASQLPETTLPFSAITAEPTAERIPFRRHPWRVAALVAACLALVVCIGFGNLTFIAEAKEYRAAVAFFEEYDLSTEGLSREEIKAVYRDITTESFTYSKTAEVIRNSIVSEQVGGYEIWQDSLSPEDVANLWKEKNYNGRFVPYVSKEYQFNVEFITNDDGLVVDKKYYFEKYDGETVLWCTEIPFSYGDYCEVTNGLIVYGIKINRDGASLKTETWIYKLDHNGNILWWNQLDNGFFSEYAEGLLVNADGSYTFFSRGDTEYLCVSRYTSEGQRILYKQTHLGDFFVGHIANFGDHYLLQVSVEEENEFARFIQVDPEGNVLDGFSYTDEKNNYVIQDMVEWGGKVYISAYVTPKLEKGEHTYGGQDEIARILKFAFNYDGHDIPVEVFTPVVRENYAAVLLACDPTDGGKLRVYYTIPGSLGAKLIISDDGRLIWETESITTTYFSIATSAFTIGGMSTVYQYAFDVDGVLVGRGKTDKLVGFYR